MPMRPFVLILTLLLLQAAGLPMAAAGSDDALKDAVEKLFFNQKALARVSEALHRQAWRHLNGSDEGLARLQRAAIHIDQARTEALHQWELLAVVDYIRDSARGDFFTLRYRGLHRARERSRELLQLVDLYSGFVDDDSADQALDHGLSLIRANIYLFESLIKIIEPSINEGTTPHSGIWLK